MISNTRLMLYVNDLEANKKFWTQHFDAKLIEEMSLPDNFVAYILQMSESFEMALFPLEFIKKYSPEVASNKPSVMFFSDKFEQLHKAIEGAGDIIDNNGTLTFNFPDPDGNYYVVANK